MESNKDGDVLPSIVDSNEDFSCPFCDLNSNAAVCKHASNKLWCWQDDKTCMIPSEKNINLIVYDYVWL